MLITWLMALLLAMTMVWANETPVEHLRFQDKAMRKKFVEQGEEGSEEEGDMIKPPKEDGGGGGTARRNGLIDPQARWLGGIIPYEVVGPYNQFEIDTLNRVFEYYANNTCIQFRPKDDDDEDYLQLVRTEGGCSSFVGKAGGAQIVRLASMCFLQFGTIAHELMHTLGFLHEQNRSDRDENLAVLYNNIKTDRYHNFIKEGEDTITDFGVPYDYNSVVHYSKRAFSKNGKDTLTPRQKLPGLFMGQRIGFTNFDLSKIIKMYCDEEYIAGPHPFEYVL